MFTTGIGSAVATVPAGAKIGKISVTNNSVTTPFLVKLGAITGGTGYTNGTYNKVLLTYLSGQYPTLYPTANITVSGGVVTSVTVVTPGANMGTSTILSAAAASIGGTGSGFQITVTEAGTNFLVIPTALPVTNTGQNGFTANWSDVGANRYYLDVSTDINFSTYVVGYNNLNVGNVTSRNVTGLISGTLYYYRARSSDGSGTSGDSNIIGSILTIPATPTAIVATAISQTGFTVNWNGVASVTGYYLDVATDAGFTTFVPGYINLSLSSGTSSQIVWALKLCEWAGVQSRWKNARYCQ